MACLEKTSKPLGDYTLPRRSKLTPFLDQLGKLPDREIAELAGVTESGVRKRRNRMGIPPHDRNPDDGFSGEISAITPFIHLLGKTSDSEIAKLAGVKPDTVKRYRYRRGIGRLGSGAFIVIVEIEGERIELYVRADEEEEALANATQTIFKIGKGKTCEIIRINPAIG